MIVVLSSLVVESSAALSLSDVSLEPADVDEVHTYDLCMLSYAV